MNGQQCDRCVAHAAAFVLIEKTGQRLYFCMHHLHHFFPEDRVYPGLSFTYSKQNLTPERTPA